MNSTKIISLCIHKPGKSITMTKNTSYDNKKILKSQSSNAVMYCEKVLTSGCIARNTGKSIRVIWLYNNQMKILKQNLIWKICRPPPHSLNNNRKQCQFIYQFMNYLLHDQTTHFMAINYALVLWCCWLGGKKGIRPVKNWVVGCWHGYLSGARCRLACGPADTTATHCLLLQ